MRQLPFNSGISFLVLGTAVPLGRQGIIQPIGGLISLRLFCSPVSPCTAAICPRVLLKEQEELGYLLKYTGQKIHFLIFEKKYI